jgi:hypothetical protein
MRISVFLLLTFLSIQLLLGQVILEGRVVNMDGESLHNINILIYPKGKEVLIAYAVSDAHGSWRTNIHSASDSLDIEASSVHYRNERRRIVNHTQTVVFELHRDVKELNTFAIKAPDIEKRGDTISYLVSSFAHEHNRSIADVLKNMPGIEVEATGRILYQGQPINRFYVEGLDLMGGRYGMISSNMPHRSVTTVEILENHQPIRILEERVPSHQAALNLKLKREVTTTGTSMLGIGIKPLLWDANITPMTFTRKFQMVNSYQANNTGHDVAKQLTAFMLQDLRIFIDRPRENPEMLSIQTIAQPDFNESRYLNNNIHLVNSNTLVRLNKDFQLRTNLYYINDSRHQQGLSYLTIFSPIDTLFFNESLQNTFHDNALHGEFTLNRNIKDNFLNNNFKFNARRDSRKGLIRINNENVYQSINIPFRNLSNDLRSVKPVGNFLVEFLSFVSYDHNPQQLQIKPARFSNILNTSDQTESLRQELELQRLFVDHSAGSIFNWKGIVFSSRLGFSLRFQQLNSNLKIEKGTTWLNAPSDFSNSIGGEHTQTYFRNEIRYRKKDFSLSASLPLSWQYLSLDDQILRQGQQLSRILFDPRINVDYLINGFWRIRGSWSFSNSLGDMDELHYGFILKNLHNLHKNAAPLSETKSHNLSMFISYRNPITSFFNSVNYFFTIRDYNLIYSNQVQADRTTIVQAYELPNTGYSHIINGQTSKYFSTTKSTLSLRASYIHNHRESLLNQQLFETVNQFITLSPQINTRIAQWLRIEYRANMSFIQTYIDSNRNNNLSMLRHYLDLHSMILRGHYLGINTEYYKYQDNVNYFFDLRYRHTIKKHRLEIEARWLNIFNASTYTSFQTTTFSIVESTYYMRPSQFVLSVKFNF